MDPYVIIQYEKKEGSIDNYLLNRIRDSKVSLDSLIKKYEGMELDSDILEIINKEFLGLHQLERELSKYYKITKTIIPNLSLDVQSLQKLKDNIKGIYINNLIKQESLSDKESIFSIVSNDDSLLSISDPNISKSDQNVSKSNSQLSSNKSSVSGSDSLLSSDNSLSGGSSLSGSDSLLSSDYSNSDSDKSVNQDVSKDDISIKNIDKSKIKNIADSIDDYNFKLVQKKNLMSSESLLSSNNSSIDKETPDDQGMDEEEIDEEAIDDNLDEGKGDDLDEGKGDDLDKVDGDDEGEEEIDDLDAEDEDEDEGEGEGEDNIEGVDMVKIGDNINNKSNAILENYYGNLYKYKFGILDSDIMDINLYNDIHIMGDETIECLNNKLLYLYNIINKDIYDINSVFLWTGYNYTLMLDRLVYDIYLQLENYLSVNTFTYENIIRYFNHLGIEINLLNNDYYSLFIKDFNDKIIDYHSFRNHIFIQNTIKDYYYYSTLNYNYVDNDKYHFINPFKLDNIINSVTFTYQNLNNKVFSDFGEIVLGEINFILKGDLEINQKYFPNYDGKPIDKHKIRKYINNLNSIYYSNEETLYFSLGQLFEYETYINGLYWKYNINNSLDITKVFNTIKLNNQIPFIVLNDPISNKIINKAYVPSFNKYDDKYEPMINGEMMKKLFNNDFDIPIENVFKKKSKNGLYICFYTDNYIETLTYTSQGKIIKIEDSINIDSNNKIISGITESSDIYKNITSPDVNNIGDIVRYRQYNNLFTYLFLDKNGKTFIYLSIPKNSYYRIDNIYNIIKNINGYCHKNLDELRYIYDYKNLENYYRKTLNNNIKLDVKFVFYNNQSTYYDINILRENIKNLNSYFEIVPKFFKIGTIVNYSINIGGIFIQRSGKIIKINFILGEVLYDIKYDIENGEIDKGISSDYISNTNDNDGYNDFYIELYYKRQSKYNYKNLVNIDYLSEFLDESDIISFIKDKFGIKHTKDAIETISFLRSNNSHSDPISIKIYLFGKYIKLDTYEYNIYVNGITNMKSLNLIKILLDKLCNLKENIIKCDNCHIDSSINLLEKEIHSLEADDSKSDDDLLDDDSDDDLLEEDGQHLKKGKLGHFEKKIKNEEIQLLYENMNIDYSESDIFTYNSNIPKLTTNYCRYLLIKTDYQLFNYKPINGSNNSYAKRTTNNPIAITNSEKILIDKKDAELYPQIEEIIQSTENKGNFNETRKKIFLAYLKKNFSSYGFCGYCNESKHEYTLDFDQKQKLIDLQNKIPTALLCKSKIRKDIWYISPRIYCFSCNKPINIWYFILKQFDNGKEIIPQKEYNPGINKSGTRCPYFMPSLEKTVKETLEYNSWRKCYNCGLDITKHDLFCPYDPTHKCNCKPLKNVTMNDMERYKKDGVEKIYNISKLIENSEDDFDKIKRGHPKGFVFIKASNRNPSEYYLPIHKIKKTDIYFDNKMKDSIYSNKDLINDTIKKFYLKYIDKEEIYIGEIYNNIYYKRYCNRSCIIDINPSEKDNEQKYLSILTNQFGYSELLRPCIVTKFHQKWYMKNDNINKYLKLTQGELYKEDRENYNYICKDFGKTLANGQLTNLPEVLFNYFNVDKYNNPLKIQHGLYNKKEKYYIRVGNEYNNNSFLHCIYKIFNLELLKMKINNFEKFRNDIVDKCSYKIFNDMDLSLLNIIFRENYNINIDAYQNFIEYIYSDEFKNHQYLLDYFTNYYHIGEELYNIIILSIIDGKLVVNCPKTFTYSSRNKYCFILQINDHYEPIGYFYNTMINFIFDKRDVCKTILKEISEKCYVSDKNKSNVYLTYDKVKSSKFNIIKHYKNKDGYIDKLLISELSTDHKDSKQVIVCIKPQIIVGIKESVYDKQPYKSKNIYNIYNYFNICPVYNYYIKKEGDTNNGIYINYNLVYIDGSLDKSNIEKVGEKSEQEGSDSKQDGQNSKIVKYKFENLDITKLDINGLEIKDTNELFGINIDEILLFLDKKGIDYTIVIDLIINPVIGIKEFLVLNKEKVKIVGLIINDIYINVLTNTIDDYLYLKLLEGGIKMATFEKKMIQFDNIDNFIQRYTGLFYYLDKNFNIRVYRYKINRDKEIIGIYLEDGSLYEYIYTIGIDHTYYKKIFMIEPQYKTDNKINIYEHNKKLVGDKLKTERYFILLKELSIYLHNNLDILKSIENIINSFIYSDTNKKNKLQKLLYTILKEITSVTTNTDLTEKNNILCSNLDSYNCIQAKHCKYSNNDSYLSNFIKLNISKMSMEDILIQWMTMPQEEKLKLKKIISKNKKDTCKICITDFNKEFNRILNDLVRNRYIISMVLNNNFNHIFKNQLYEKKSNLEVIFTNDNIDDIIFKFTNLIHNYINHYINFNIYNDIIVDEKLIIDKTPPMDKKLILHHVDGLISKQTGLYTIIKKPKKTKNMTKILYNNEEYDKKFNKDSEIYKQLIELNKKRKPNITEKSNEYDINIVGSGMFIIDINMKPKFIII